ncbi:MAG: response regulator [Verrucomicrobiota bacterium]
MSNTHFTAYTQEKTHDLDENARLDAVKKILVVDDDPAFVEILQVFLESCGYQVESALDGVLGIKKIMVHDYAVILCDMVMPNLAGDMFYMAVERVKPHLCRRFVFMTGYQGDAKVDAFIRRVRGLVVWKPFEMHILLEAVQAAERKGDHTTS